MMIILFKVDNVDADASVHVHLKNGRGGRVG